MIKNSRLYRYFSIKKIIKLEIKNKKEYSSNGFYNRMNYLQHLRRENKISKRQYGKLHSLMMYYKSVIKSK